MDLPFPTLAIHLESWLSEPGPLAERPGLTAVRRLLNEQRDRLISGWSRTIEGWPTRTRLGFGVACLLVDDPLAETLSLASILATTPPERLGEAQAFFEGFGTAVSTPWLRQALTQSGPGAELAAWMLAEASASLPLADLSPIVTARLWTAEGRRNLLCLVPMVLRDEAVRHLQDLRPTLPPDLEAQITDLIGLLGMSAQLHPVKPSPPGSVPPAPAPAALSPETEPNPTSVAHGGSPATTPPPTQADPAEGEAAAALPPVSRSPATPELAPSSIAEETPPAPAEPDAPPAPATPPPPGITSADDVDTPLPPLRSSVQRSSIPRTVSPPPRRLPRPAAPAGPKTASFAERLAAALSNVYVLLGLAGAAVALATVVLIRWNATPVEAPRAIQPGERVWIDAVTRRPITESFLMADKEFRMGEIFRIQSRFSDAQSFYRAAVAIDPAHVEAIDRLGYCLFKLKAYEAAEAQFRKALAIEPRFYRSHFYMGRLHQRAQRWTEALAAYRQAFAARKDLTQIGIEYLDLLLRLGMFEEARPIAAELVSRFPTNREIAELQARLLREAP